MGEKSCLMIFLIFFGLIGCAFIAGGGIVFFRTSQIRTVVGTKTDLRIAKGINPITQEVEKYRAAFMLSYIPTEGIGKNKTYTHKITKEFKSEVKAQAYLDSYGTNPIVYYNVKSPIHFSLENPKRGNYITGGVLIGIGLVVWLCVGLLAISCFRPKSLDGLDP